MSRRRLRQSPRPRLRQRTVLIYAAAATLVTIAIGVGVFIYINLSNSSDSLANRNRLDYTSSGTGDWDNAGTWEKSQPRMDDTPGNTVNVDAVNINGYITKAGDLEIRGNTLITIIDTLRIIGNLTLSSQAELVIDENGLLIVENDYILGGNSSTTNNGGTVVARNLESNGSSAIQNNDQFYVFGDVTNSGNGNFNGGSDPSNSNFQTETNLIEENTELYEFSGGSSTLPITLAYFRAEKNGDHSLLEWGTVNETDNDFFTIERSTDGKRFQIIEKITGAGDSDVELDYEYVDDQPLSGPNYYRLKQTDYNGDFEYFNIVLVHHDEIAGDTAPITIDRIGPNPFQNQFKVSYTIQESANIRLTITNINGQRVDEQSYNAYPGANEIIYQEGSIMKSGIYLLTLSHGNYTSDPIRLIKK